MKLMMLTIGALVNVTAIAAVEWEAQTGEALVWLLGSAGGAVGFLIRSTCFEMDKTRSISQQTCAASAIGMIFGPGTSWGIARFTGLPYGPLLLLPVSTILGLGGLHFIVIYGPKLMDAVGMGALKKVKDNLPSE